MIQQSPHIADDPQDAMECPKIWGLGASQLHDAYWRAHGVQCFRRGSREKFQDGADFYLLIEPDQLVLFDMHALAERLAWRKARVTRLRVVDQDKEVYGERIELDEAGHVLRIGRRYRPRTQSAYRVILTRNRRIARCWMSAEVRQDGWKQIRKLAGWTNIDLWRCEGCCYTPKNPREESRLIDRLVEMWKSPNASIKGLGEIAEGVWARQGECLDEEMIAVGPLWIGTNGIPEQPGFMFGPAWSTDVNGENPAPDPLPVRDIHEIDPGENRNPAAPDSQSSDEVSHPNPWYGFIKRLFDITCSLVGMILLLPVLMVIASCIFISDGRPIFYGGIRQKRGGGLFRCWKFRTMYRNADEIKHTLSAQNAADGPQFFMQNDPRVLRFGHFLRRYHLDELPQLYNVLIGEMSFVGPRPSPDEENQKCPAWREIRLSVRPGITGLWQLRRTREPGLDFQEWIRYDVQYVEQANFWLDLKILFSTFYVILEKGSENASDEKR